MTQRIVRATAAIVAALALLVPAIGGAQSTVSTQATLTAVNASAQVTLSGQTQCTTTIAGTFSGTLSFAGVPTNASASLPLPTQPFGGGTSSTTETAAGLYQTPVAGIGTFRVTLTALSSGTPSVAISCTRGANASGGSSGGGGGGTTTVSPIPLPVVCATPGGCPTPNPVQSVTGTVSVGNFPATPAPAPTNAAGIPIVAVSGAPTPLAVQPISGAPTPVPYPTNASGQQVVVVASHPPVVIQSSIPLPIAAIGSAFVALPAATANGSALTSGPTGVEITCSPGGSVTYTIAASQPSSAPTLTRTFANPSSASSYASDQVNTATGVAVYVTATSGTCIYRSI